MNLIQTGASYVATYGVFIALAVLIVTSLLVRDVTFPSAHPFLFAFETLMVGLMPALMYVVVVHYSRCVSPQYAFVLFSFMAVHFAVFHALLQFSGAYETIF
jgi:hypothetical protein